MSGETQTSSVLSSTRTTLPSTTRSYQVCLPEHSSSFGRVRIRWRIVAKFVFHLKDLEHPRRTIADDQTHVYHGPRPFLCTEETVSIVQKIGNSPSFQNFAGIGVGSSPSKSKRWLPSELELNFCLIAFLDVFIVKSPSADLGRWHGSYHLMQVFQVS